MADSELNLLHLAVSEIVSHWKRKNIEDEIRGIFLHWWFLKFGEVSALLTAGKVSELYKVHKFLNFIRFYTLYRGKNFFFYQMILIL